MSETTSKTDSQGPFAPDDDDGLEADSSDVELPPPDLKTARLGTLGEIWTVWRHIKKRRKMVKQGKVEWYLIDNSFPKPKYIEPEPNGGGIPEYKHDGVTYLFPRTAMVANEQNGAWTVVHKKGDSEPLNLREPDEHAIPPDVLEEYKQMTVSSSPPSFWDKLDITGKDAFLYMIAAIIGFAFLQGAMGGVF